MCYYVEVFFRRQVAVAPRPRRGYSVEAATAAKGFLRERRFQRGRGYQLKQKIQSVIPNGESANRV